MPLTGEAKAAYQRAYHQRQKVMRAAFRAGYEGARKAETRETGSPETGERPETRETEGRLAEQADSVRLGSQQGGEVATEPVGSGEEARQGEDSRHTRHNGGRVGSGKGWGKSRVNADTALGGGISPRVSAIVAHALSGQHRNLTEAARAAGVIDEGGRMSGSLQARVTIAYMEVMDRAGGTPQFIADNLVRLARARQTKFFAHEGRVLDERTIDDNEVQLKATVELGKQRGLYPRDADGASGPGSIHITLEQVAPTDGQPAQAQRAVIRIGE